jgi:hypothetical protein
MINSPFLSPSANWAAPSAARIPTKWCTMNKVWLSALFGAALLLGYPGRSSAHRDGRGGGFHGGFDRMFFDRGSDRRSFEFRFDRGFFDRRFDRRFFDPHFERRFFDPRFDRPFFERDFERRFFDARFDRPFFDRQFHWRFFDSPLYRPF